MSCKEFGVRDVIVGGITTRNTDFLRKRCLGPNAVLANLCKSNGYTFIDNIQPSLVSTCMMVCT